MDSITLDEVNKKRIQKFIKQEIGFYGYEQDIALLEQKGQLSEGLAREVFRKVINDAHRTRTMLEPDDDNEFKVEIEEAFNRYDKIPKPKQLEKYGFYDGAYDNMELEDIYSNMQIAFELRELDNKYYGCKNLRNIADTVINSIDGIEKYQIELQSEEKEELKKIQEELRVLLREGKTDINGIQDRVNLYNNYATNIWNNYLTDITDTRHNEYRWIVHNLNKGELKGDFRYKYMSTSLITNNTMGVYGSSKYGLIIKPKHIISASYRDTYTLNTRNDEENLFNIKPPIMLPQEIEDICIQQTIEENGEMLNYEKTPIYSELVLDEYEIEGVYYISYGERELAKDYERAKKVAEERGLPLIERDISKCRAEHGLKPMTENAKRNLCENILWKCCIGDSQLEQTYRQISNRFIQNNYQNFYEKFMQLKESPEFSKENILRLFADITRDDLYFGKISQNIDEMHLSEEEKEVYRAEKEYGLTGIKDMESLQRRLNKSISEGIFYSADKQNSEKLRKFEMIKKVIPQYEELKTTYLQLRQLGLEDELYKNIDFKNISYEEILERANSILKEKDKVKENIIQQDEETIAEPQKKENNTSYRINKFGEIIRENNKPRDTTVLEKVEQFKISNTVEYKKESIVVKTEKELERKDKQMQEVKSSTAELWMARFDNWYNAIDKIPQNVKNKFIKIKSDIVKAISDNLVRKQIKNDERTNSK